jgi:hypothetical protein
MWTEIREKPQTAVEATVPGIAAVSRGRLTCDEGRDDSDGRAIALVPKVINTRR